METWTHGEALMKGWTHKYLSTLEHKKGGKEYLRPMKELKSQEPTEELRKRNDLGSPGHSHQIPLELEYSAGQLKVRNGVKSGEVPKS